MKMLGYIAACLPVARVLSLGESIAMKFRVRKSGQFADRAIDATAE